jgi:hypothetical protein
MSAMRSTNVEQEARYCCLIGAQKAGTTSLFYYLGKHPEVHSIVWKEGKLFLDSPPKPEHVRRFEDLARGRKPDQWLFETSTYYTKFPQYRGVPQRIAEKFPDARFIYLVRDPVDRIWSQYCDYLSRDWERREFRDAIRENPEYFDYSRYYQQLQQYLAVFPRERMLVLVFEEFIRDKIGTLKQIFEFLDIDAGFIPENINEKFNDGGAKRGVSLPKRMVMHMPGFRSLPWRFRHWIKSSVGPDLPLKASVLTSDLRAELAAELQDDTLKFAELLGRDIPSWPTLQQTLQV